LICFISDVHSQFDRLQKAVDYALSQNLQIIFLGDIFDSKIDYSDSVAVLNLIESLVNSGHICINSNHQDKLSRYLKGNNVTQNNGLDITIKEFEETNVDKDKLFKLLTSFPYGVVCKNSYGKEFRVAHAYFSDRIQISDYKDQYFVYGKDINQKTRKTMIYGLLDRDNTRLSWWEEVNSEQNFVRVAGHYHRVIETETSLVLDSSCGSGGPLSLYNCDTGVIKEF
jgi:hypothetical protein